MADSGISIRVSCTGNLLPALERVHAAIHELYVYVVLWPEYVKNTRRSVLSEALRG